MELKIDKSAWVTVTLGEVAFEVSDRINAPAESEYDRFVGLEHFVSGEVKIQEWESTRSLVSAAKAFRKGDVLFARRNAYLRRASMVDFDGCCSGDAYVLRENNEVIVPGLLPFIVNSNSLWDFANSNAAGTMSKRVKWKDLANYEFLLPPKDQQAEIAELLWALDESFEKHSRVLNYLRLTQVVNSRHFFDALGNAPATSFGELGKWRTGSTPSKKRDSFWANGEYVWVTPKDFGLKESNSSKDLISEEALGETGLRLFDSGLFAVVWRSGVLQHSLPVMKMNCAFTVNQDVKVLMPESGVEADFVRIFLDCYSDRIRQKSVKQGTTVESIATEVFMSQKIPLGTIAEQQALKTAFDNFENAILAMQEKRNHLLHLKSALITECIGGHV